MQGILNRRYLRVKAFQALYAHQASNNDLVIAEKNMLKSVNDIYDLYLYMLLLIVDVKHMALRNVEQNKEKRLPTDEDLSPNLKFVENEVINLLEDNIEFKSYIEKKKISWAIESDNVKKLWRKIKSSQEYIEYMEDENRSFQQDKEFVITIFKNYIAEFEVLHAYLEDRSIYWYDDLSLVCINIVKMINHIKAKANEHSTILLPLFKDKEDDIKFVKEVFRKVIMHEDDLNVHIEEHTKNWEVERIARLDVLLMKMALTELLYFPTIPVKVTLNEYIELAKNYSTPNSRVFINGVLDNMANSLRSDGKMNKTGRGLIE